MKSKMIAIHDIGGLLAVSLVFIMLIPSLAWSLEPPPSLKTVSLPPIPNINQYVKDKNAAIQLGKALFWDIQVGSDGQACASCHFHAGADNRLKNQLTPQLRDKRFSSGDANFGNNPLTGNKDYPQFGPNYTLKAEDFPLTKLADPSDPKSVIADTNDIISSAGVFSARFISSIPFVSQEKNIPQNDPLAHVGLKNARRVELRHALSVINAAFNFVTFWDGRGNNIFNGVNQFGASDQKAHILVNNNGVLKKEKVRLKNSGLGGAAAGPALNTIEMSYKGRTFPHLAHKLFSLTPLGKQMVHPQDSVLGALSRARVDTLGRLVGRPGLNVSYETLVKRAFNDRYWNYKQQLIQEEPSINLDTTILSFDEGTGTTGGSAQKMGQGLAYRSIRGSQKTSLVSSLGLGPRRGRNLQTDKFTQMELNFSFFFSVAVEMYERTLISDDALYDQYREGKATLTPLQLLGLDVFMNKGKCINCHGGAEFTNASVEHCEGKQVERREMVGGEAFCDAGFYNIGVRPTLEDRGRGRFDPFGSPFSFARLAFLKRGVNPPPGVPSPVRQIVGDYGDFIQDLPCSTPCDLQRIAVDGAFKTPGLRDVELTGPYFHNGGKATLRQVVDFFDRGGDFSRFNLDNLDPDIQKLNLTEQEKKALVAFMLTLTDERVRFERAPFDHPELFVPNGQKGDEQAITGDSNKYTRLGFKESDIILQIPAVGQDGRNTPLHRFMDLDPFQPE